jgi:hypothetical protein
MGYIFYYEKILDLVVDGEIELLVKWMEIEHSCGGVHNSTRNFVDHGEREWDMEERVKASTSSWNIGNFYQMPDPTKASKYQIEKVVNVVLCWLSSHFDQHEDAPPPPPSPIEETTKKGEPRGRQGRFQTRRGRRKYRKARFEDEVEKSCTCEHFH